MGIGERIVQARDAKGLKQAELARELGTTPAQMWRWETGKRTPRLAMLRLIAEKLGVSLDDLLGSESERIAS